MPVRREQVAAALKYLGDKADVKRRYERLTSLDQQQDTDAIDMALEMGGSLVPGVGPALAARDIERARRANDPAGMAIAGASALPLGKLIGALKGYDPVMREIDVYHGSPHRFDEFDASKIGTGEGQQAYGHGIYVAEQKDVADMYRRALTPHQVSDNDAQSLASYAMRQRHNKDDAIKWLQKEKTTYKSEQSPETLAQYDAAINVLRGGNVPKVGNLYTADLPDEMVDRMLDYDLPINQQNPYVLAALDRAGINTQSTALAGPMAQGQEKHLAKFGIPGIKYLDAGSRGQGGTGTRNFVVFPGEEKKVKILKRE